MNVNENSIAYLRELEQTLNPPMGISHVRAILTYIERGDLQSAIAVYQNDGDKNYQYPKLQDHLEYMFGCRTHLRVDCEDWLCARLRDDLTDRLNKKGK
jgi:hypothetical protein